MHQKQTELFIRNTWNAARMLVVLNFQIKDPKKFINKK